MRDAVLANERADGRRQVGAGESHRNAVELPGQREGIGDAAFGRGVDALVLSPGVWT